MRNCLQYAGKQAVLIQRLLLFLEPDRLNGHHHWDQQKVMPDDWFSEWEGGRRPLSTTWPWNIKPSLMVLWGVCWMFYCRRMTRPGHRPVLNPDRHQSESALNMSNVYSQNGFLDPDGLLYENGVAAWRLQPNDNNEDDNVGTDGLGVTPSHHTRPCLTDLGIPGTSILAVTHTLSRAKLTLIAADCRSNQGRLRAAPSPYISDFSRTSPSVDLATTSKWPDLRGIDSPFSPFSHNEWRQPNSTHNTVTPSTTQPLDSYTSSTPSLIPYVATFHNPQTLYAELPAWSYTNDYISTFGIDLSMRDSQDYPSPQHSEASDRAISLCPTFISTSMSPLLPTQPSTPTIHTIPNHNSLHDIPRRTSSLTSSPPRNSSGQIYCDHHDCIATPPIFARKCEWSKHIDKHTRPYHCSEPGCEQIRGFTYSGGLLRHQREVHRQHGGPKAPRMCPHRNCKRSTGTGFSRKENLHEHLRRVHGGMGMEDRDGSAAGEAENAGKEVVIVGGGREGMRVLVPQVLEPRRKRPFAEVEDGIRDEDGNGLGEGGDESSLQGQIKRLKAELAEKDARLRSLEGLVHRMLNGQSGLG